MFDHEVFDRHDIRDIPLNRDIVLMDVVWMKEWEAEWIKTARGQDADPYVVGFVTPVSVSNITPTGLEICWYPNTFDRFHEVKTFLPADQISLALDIHAYDCRLTVFVNGDWLRRLHLRANSLFVLIDASDMTHEIQMGRLDRTKLVAIRDGLDEIAAKHPDVSFISFADSLLLKTNWTVGMVGSGVEYSYLPEAMLQLFGEIRDVYRAVLDLEIYGVFAQGSNEYYDDPLLHISASHNHISLNSLGLPFAQLMQIEAAARKAIRGKRHGKYELYLDEDFYNSLRFVDYDTRTCSQYAPYEQKLSGATGTYFYHRYDELFPKLKI